MPGVQSLSGFGRVDQLTTTTTGAVRMRLIARFLFIALVVGLWACTDTTTTDGWSFDDDPDAQWQKLDGLPGPIYEYMGQVGQRHYFVVGYRSPSVAPVVPGGAPIVAYYSPGDGWREDAQLGELLAGGGLTSVTRRLRHLSILEVDGFNMLVRPRDHPDEYLVLRTPDEGKSWERVGTLPQDDGVRHLVSDGTNAFVYVEEAPERQRGLWRSVDAGQTWESIPVDARIRTLVGLPGRLVVETLDNVRLSRDGGETWEDVDPACRTLPGQSRWLSFGGRWLALSPRGDLFAFEPAAGCSSVELEGLPQDSALDEARVVGDALYGASGERLWRADLARGRWEEVTVSDVLEPVVNNGTWVRRLFDLGEGRLGLLNWNGLWQRAADGDRWTFAGHEFAFASPILEFDEAVFTKTAGDLFLGGLDGQWERTSFLGRLRWPFGRGMFFVRQGRLFAASGATAIYEIELSEVSIEVVWENRDARGYSTGHGQLADIRFAEDSVLVSAQGSLPAPLLPGRQEYPETGSYRGGGIHSAQSLGGEFAPFGEGLPEALEGGPASIQSMVIHKGEAWVVTGVHGVWRAGINRPIWTQAHDGLPTAEDAPAAAARQLVALDDDLFALSNDAVYLREAQAWRRLTTDDFAEPLRESGWIYLLDLVLYRGKPLIVSPTGLFALDKRGGQELVWQPDDSWITAGSVLSSDLYVGVAYDGIWRYGPID